MTTPTPDTIPESVLEAMARRCIDSEHQGGEQMVRAALQAAEALGYVLVPKELTDAMLEAAYDGYHNYRTAPERWTDMIAAAPKVTG